jgi:hypothetical protein
VDQEVCPLIEENHAAAGERRADQRAQRHRPHDQGHEQHADPDRERHSDQHQEGRLPPVEQDHVEVVRFPVVGAMGARRHAVELPAVNPDRLRVQQVDVDRPFAERIDGDHRRHGDGVSPARIADEDADHDQREDARPDGPGRLPAQELPPCPAEGGDPSRMHLLPA